MKCFYNHFFYFFILFFSFNVYAQHPQWQWVVQAGGNTQELANDITCDSQGNIYITGYFTMNADFGSEILSSYGSEDIFVARYDADGNVQWARHAGSSTGSNFGEQGRSIAIDTAGNVYITGSFLSEAWFDDDTIKSNGTWDIFIAKYNSDGHIVWVKNAGGKNHDHGNAIALDHQGNIYVTGTFSYDAWFDDDSLHSDWSGQEVFLAKYNINSELVWVKKFSGPYSPTATAICVDDSNNVYVAGGYSNRITFDQTYSMEFSGGNNRIYIVKFDQKGDFKWARQAGGLLNDYVTSIGSDPEGNVFATGHFFLDAVFESDTLSVMNSENNADIFIAKYNNTGHYQWARQLDPTLGTAKALTTVEQDYFTICGLFTDSLLVEDEIIYSDGDEDIFVAGYGGDGNLLWLNQAGGSSSGDQATGIDSDENGNIYVTGSIHSLVHFSPADTLNTGGGDKIFVAKIGDAAVSIARDIMPPNQYRLYQNYPNPFNPSTTIRFQLEKAGKVKIVLFDVMGKAIKTVCNCFKPAGMHEVIVDANNMASGIYFYRFDLNNQVSDIKKMVLLR